MQRGLEHGALPLVVCAALEQAAQPHSPAMVGGDDDEHARMMGNKAMTTQQWKDELSGRRPVRG